MLKAAYIGKDGRTSAIAASLRKSPKISNVFQLSSGKGKDVVTETIAQITKLSSKDRPDFVVVGPEEPLAYGVVDALEKSGIPSIGPKQSLARLESSKSFTRDLVSKHKIPGNPEYEVFKNLSGVQPYLKHLKELGGFVIKPDGLTGGKGVKISDAHLFSIDDAIAYCEEIFQEHAAVVIEEKLEGEEFSLQSFCDGSHVKDMIVVQDHKRAFDGDTGPNTGGMGSYSCANHRLPFLSQKDLKQASEINALVARALWNETGEKYKGVLYGGFMLTSKGIRLLEYNARFGDPETLNVLSVLKTDFADICLAILNETLHKLPIEFENLATVCKYVVPDGYPDRPVKGCRIDLSNVPKESAKLRRFFASVDEVPKKNYEYILTGSRAVGFVGIGKTLEEAEAIAEEAASAVQGRVFHRKDIGTTELIDQRVHHMRSLLASAKSKSHAAT